MTKETKATAIKVLYFLSKNKVVIKKKNLDHTRSVESLMGSRIRSTRNLNISVEYLFTHTIREDRNHYGETPTRAGQQASSRWDNLDKFYNKIKNIKVPVAFKKQVVSKLPKGIQAVIIKKDADLQ